MKTFALFLSLLLAFSFSGVAQQTTLTLTAAQLGTAAATLASAADAEGGTGLQYKWYKNGVEVGGATAATYTVPAADYAEGTATITYTRAAKCAECADWLFANPVAVTICAAAALPTVSLDYACAANQTATFTATGGNGANEFAWSTDGATYAAFAAAGTQAVNLATAQAATRFVKARSTANGCLSSPVSRYASLPAAALTLSGGTPTTADLADGVACPDVAVTATASVVGGSGAAATNGYSWDGAAYAGVAASAKTPNSTTLSTVRWSLSVRDTKGCTSANTTAASVSSAYVGADYVAGSCAKRTTGTQNWQARISDARDGINYDIFSTPAGRWMFGTLLLNSSAGLHCGTSCQPSLHLSYNPNIAKNACPSGWRLPEMADYFIMGTGSSVTPVQMRNYGLTVRDDLGEDYSQACNTCANNSGAAAPYETGCDRTSGTYSGSGYYIFMKTAGIIKGNYNTNGHAVRCVSL